MSKFHEYLIKRIGYTVVTLFFVSLVIFAVTQILPGNAADVILGRYATPDRVAVVEEQLGLDNPLHLQYIDWLLSILSGDWGTSFIYNQPIGEIILPRLIRSLQLALVSLTMMTLLGIPLGVIAASRSGTLTGTLVTSGAYLGVSVPAFVVAILLLLFFAGPYLIILPSGGYEPMSSGIWTWFQYLILPSLALTIGGTTHILRQTRTEMIETLQADYTRSARIKGVPEFWAVTKHALRNGLLPAITVIGLQFGWLMGGLVVIEEIFTYPGIGQLVIIAIENRDIPLLQILILIIATSYMVANLVADIVYTRLDPRIEYE